MKVLLDNSHWVKVKFHPLVDCDKICCLNVYCLDSEAECKNCILRGKELPLSKLKKEGLVKEHD